MLSWGRCAGGRGGVTSKKSLLGDVDRAFFMDVIGLSLSLVSQRLPRKGIFYKNIPIRMGGGVFYPHGGGTRIPGGGVVLVWSFHLLRIVYSTQTIHLSSYHLFPSITPALPCIGPLF